MYDFYKIVPQQGFSAGKFYTSDPKLRTYPHHLTNFIGIHLRVWVFFPFCMAVDTGKVAARGEADAQVRYRAVVGIFQYLCHILILEIFCDKIELGAALARGFCIIGLHHVKVLLRTYMQFGKICALEGFHHKIPAML